MTNDDLTRRRLIRTAAATTALGVTGALAGCGQPEDDGGTEPEATEEAGLATATEEDGMLATETETEEGGMLGNETETDAGGGAIGNETETETDAGGGAIGNETETETDDGGLFGNESGGDNATATETEVEGIFGTETETENESA